ncbi:tetratricopeptide repeat protein [Morganella psychrotolerans]|uniref:tetratricopeptide repeat protein n=1 Tax=Morganella psychrotolerans TaxID=368603 RepID=UPI00082B3A3D|nr:SEL1-like repeat protein [Morganella psychrotolerans]
MRIAIAAGLCCTVLFFTSPLMALPSPVKRQEAAALSGNITAQIKLADDYLAQKETVQAEYWFRKAAEQNNPYAQNSLGKLLLLTDQSPDSLMQAKVWFEKAATQQYAPAQTNLGNVYLHLADLNDKKKQ